MKTIEYIIAMVLLVYLCHYSISELDAIASDPLPFLTSKTFNFGAITDPSSNAYHKILVAIQSKV